MDAITGADLITILLSSILGGGVVGVIGWAGILWHLRKQFFTREEGEGFGQRLNVVEREGTALSRQNHDHLARLESEIRRDLVKPIQEITKTLQELREARAADKRDMEHHGTMIQEIRDWMKGEK